MALVTYYAPGMLSGTIVRPSLAQQITADGVAQAVAANVLRNAHYYQGRRTILIERESTNLISEPHRYAGYTSSRIAQIVAEGVLAPDGSSMADVIVEDDTTGTHALSLPAEQAITPVVGQPVPVSWFVRAIGRTQVQLDLQGGTWEGGGSASVQVNLTTGMVTGGNAQFRHAELLGDGWVWLAVRDTPTADTPFRPRLILRSDSNNYTGDGVSGIAAWGLMVELNHWGPASFTPDFREEDRFYLPFDLTPGQDISIYAKFIEGFGAITPNAGVVMAGSPTPGNSRLVLQANATGSGYRGQITDGATNGYSALPSIPTWGDEVELLLTYDASEDRIVAHQSINGGAVETASQSAAVDLGAAFGEPRLYIGSTGNTNQSIFRGLEVKVSDAVNTMQEIRDLQSPIVILRPISTPSTEWPISHYSNIDEETLDVTNYNESDGTGEQTDIQRFQAVPSRIVTMGGVSFVAASFGKVDDLTNEYVSEDTGEPLSLELEMLVAGGASYDPPITWTVEAGFHATHLLEIPEGTVVTGNPRVRSTTRRG